MNTEELKNMIQLYFDGELEKNKEPLLFTSLSQDAEARDYFKSMNLLRNTVKGTEEEFPQELEERIFYSLKKEEVKNKSSFFNLPITRIISYSIAVMQQRLKR
jgi:negative regulator of sigma E activity